MIYKHVFQSFILKKNIFQKHVNTFVAYCMYGKTGLNKYGKALQKVTIELVHQSCNNGENRNWVLVAIRYALLP